jgi:hypothetical protein
MEVDCDIKQVRELLDDTEGTSNAKWVLSADKILLHLVAT